jgi:hypothetical protein
MELWPITEAGRQLISDFSRRNSLARSPSRFGSQTFSFLHLFAHCVRGGLLEPSEKARKRVSKNLRISPIFVQGMQRILSEPRT